MVQYNYDRKYTLSITRPERSFPTVGDDLDPNNLPSPFSFAYQPKEDLVSITNTTVEINDLHFTADIGSTNQTQGSDAKKSVITIFNLSEQTRSIIARKDNLVVLKAGYQSYADELPIIFSGTVVSHFTKKNGQDIETTLECADGYTAITTARTSVRVQAGKTYRDVFLALAGEMNKAGIPTGKVVTDYGYLLSTKGVDITPNLTGLNKYLPPQDQYLMRGWTFNGKVKDALDEVCESFNHTWQIVNNRLYIYPKYYPEMVGSVTLDETQIISLDEVQDGTQSGSNPTEATGLKITTLLDGRIEDAKALTIRGSEKSGTYPIRSVEHKLDYEGQAWHTIIECAGG